VCGYSYRTLVTSVPPPALRVGVMKVLLGVTKVLLGVMKSVAGCDYAMLNLHKCGFIGTLMNVSSLYICRV
jgi:hypothetical protein